MAADPALTLSLDEPLLDVEQAAALLAVRPSWIRDATRAGRLPCIRVGKHMRFTRPMLEDWAAQHRTKTPRPAAATPAAPGGRDERRADNPSSQRPRRARDATRPARARASSRDG